jgi:hypothetical protein
VGAFGHRQAHGQVVAESPELIAPARGNRPNLQAREVRVLVTDKVTDKALVDAASFHVLPEAIAPS